MGYVCHNICERFKTKPKSLGQKKWCSICSIFVRTNELRCKCCGVKLRIKARYKSKAGPRTNWPELFVNREANCAKAHAAVRALGMATAKKVKETLQDELFLTIRQIAFRAGLTTYTVMYTVKHHPTMFGSAMSRLGHKKERRVWLLSTFNNVATV